MSVSILRPWWPSDVPERQRNHDWTLDWWHREFPDWRVVEGPLEPSSRCAAVNWCAEQTDGEMLIVADVDCWCPPAQLVVAVAVALTARGLVYPHDRFENLSEAVTDQFFASLAVSAPSVLGEPDLVTPGSAGGMVILRRDQFDELGGMDERFVGWGFEDAAFDAAATTLLGESERVEGPVWHLWHPPAPDFDAACKTYQDNRERGKLYDAALHDQHAMRELLTS
jgi:hypothetical protein